MLSQNEPIQYVPAYGIIARPIFSLMSMAREPFRGYSMSFLISDAVAQTGGAAAQPDPLMQMLPLLVLGVVFYFLLIRPQMKRAKEHKQLVNTLSKGNEVITNGGLVGKITEVGENILEIELAKDVRVKVQREAISTILPKGSMKNM